jgi:acyl carrier protein
MDDVRSRLVSVIGQALDRDIHANDICGDKLATELGLNSIDSMEILIRVESEFGIRIDDDDLDLALLASLDHLESYVVGRLPQSA